MAAQRTLRYVRGMADEILDCVNLLCPLPVLRARKRLLAMESGALLAVQTTDPMALIDLPHFCGQSGHAYLGAETEGAVTTHRIRRA